MAYVARYFHSLIGHVYLPLLESFELVEVWLAHVPGLCYHAHILIEICKSGRSCCDRGLCTWLVLERQRLQARVVDLVEVGLRGSEVVVLQGGNWGGSPFGLCRALSVHRWP